MSDWLKTRPSEQTKIERKITPDWKKSTGSLKQMLFTKPEGPISEEVASRSFSMVIQRNCEEIARGVIPVRRNCTCVKPASIGDCQKTKNTCIAWLALTIMNCVIMLIPAKLVFRAIRMGYVRICTNCASRSRVKPCNFDEACEIARFPHVISIYIYSGHKLMWWTDIWCSYDKDLPSAPEGRKRSRLRDRCTSMCDSYEHRSCKRQNIYALQPINTLYVLFCALRENWCVCELGRQWRSNLGVLSLTEVYLIFVYFLYFVKYLFMIWKGSSSYSLHLTGNTCRFFPSFFLVANVIAYIMRQLHTH